MPELILPRVPERSSMVLERPQYQWLDPEHLSPDLSRYLADLLIGHLRDDVWDERIDETYVPIRAPGENPGFKTIGKGYPSSPGSSHYLVFTAPPIYELGIDQKHLVVLDAVDYSGWCRGEKYRFLPEIDRLIHVARPEIRVFVSEPSGYGTNQRLKMRRAKSVTREQAEASLELLKACCICNLGG